MDGIKRETNHLKLELVNKNKIISKLEMRLESDTLPFQKKAELAEKKVFSIYFISLINFNQIFYFNWPSIVYFC